MVLPNRRRPRPRRQGDAPFVSDKPPTRASPEPRVVNPYETRDRRRANDIGGRVIAVFGPPCVGLSMLLRILHEESNTDTALVRPDFGPLDEQIRTAKDNAEVVLLDGFPKTVDGVQYLWDHRLVTPGDGAIVRLDCDHELLLNGRRKKPAPTRQALTQFRERLGPIEERVRLYNMPYFLVHNDDSEQALFDLARRARLR